MATDAIAVVEASALKRDRGGFAPGDSVRVHVKVDRGREGAGPDLRGDRHPEARRGRPRDLHGPARVLRRRRRADLPAPLPAGRAGPGREVRARPALQALLPPGAHRQGRAPAGEAAGAADRRPPRRPPRATSSRATSSPARRQRRRRAAWATPECAGAASGPLQAGLFELEEDLYAQERGAWARGLWVAGVDEVGRGPLAGPVVAAAVILDPTAPIDGLRDSKLLTAAAATAARARDPAPRARLRRGPRRPAADRHGQRAAGDLARHAGRARSGSAVAARASSSSTGNLRIPGVTCAQRAIIAGDRRSASVAAASILAKVARDAFMLRADRRYPEYGFRQHKGYATAAHLEALARLGPCPLHRRSFHGVGHGVGPRRRRARGPFARASALLTMSPLALERPLVPRFLLAGFADADRPAHGGAAGPHPPPAGPRRRRRGRARAVRAAGRPCRCARRSRASSPRWRRGRPRPSSGSRPAPSRRAESDRASLALVLAAQLLLGRYHRAEAGRVATLVGQLIVSTIEEAEDDGGASAEETEATDEPESAGDEATAAPEAPEDRKPAASGAAGRPT